MQATNLRDARSAANKAARGNKTQYLRLVDQYMREGIPSVATSARQSQPITQALAATVETTSRRAHVEAPSTYKFAAPTPVAPKVEAVAQAVATDLAQRATSEESKLAESAKRGNKAAFDKIVVLLRKPVERLCMQYMHEPHAAGDAMQDTFIKAYVSLDRWENGTNFRAWILRIASNICKDALSKQKVRRSASLDDALGYADQDQTVFPLQGSYGKVSPHQAVERGELKRKIDAAMATLSPAHREAIYLFDVEGLKYKEIAEQEGVPIGTVMSRISVARQKLQDQLAGTRSHFTLSNPAFMLPKWYRLRKNNPSRRGVRKHQR